MIKGATFLGLVIGSLLAVFVFAVKYEVQDLEHNFSALNHNIETEQQSIHVLLAEWSHLNNPVRLRELAKRHLGVDSVMVQQIGNLEAIPMRVEDIKTKDDKLAFIRAAVEALSEQGQP